MCIPRHTLRILFGILCLLPGLAHSQQNEFKLEEEDAGTQQRKNPGMFHRPSEATASKQLSLADTLRQEGKLKRAMKQYNNLVHAWHDTPEGVTAQRALADLLLELGKHKQAFEAYQYMVDFYAGQFPFEPVIEKQFQIANVIKNQRHARFWILPGLLDPQQALPLFETIVKNAPTWERSQEALFNIALIHEEAEDFDKAVDQYERIQLRYPNGRYAASAAFARACCLQHVALQRGRDEGRIRNALSAFSTYLRDHPSDGNAATARKHLDELKTLLSRLYYERAVYYDTVEKNAKAAEIAYRDFVRTFPMSDLREKAEARMAELGDTTGKKP